MNGLLLRLASALASPHSRLLNGAHALAAAPYRTHAVAKAHALHGAFVLCAYSQLQLTMPASPSKAGPGANLSPEQIEEIKEVCCAASSTTAKIAAWRSVIAAIALL